MGLGTHLLRGIYREYIGRNEVKDITGNLILMSLKIHLIIILI